MEVEHPPGVGVRGNLELPSIGARNEAQCYSTVAPSFEGPGSLEVLSSCCFRDDKGTRLFNTLLKY